jgi:hypothetical protein
MHDRPDIDLTSRFGFTEVSPTTSGRSPSPERAEFAGSSA